MTGVTCALAGGGGGGYSGSATMTIGYDTFDVTAGDTRYVGYNAGYTPTIGAMSNRVFGGTVLITALYYTDFDVYDSGVFSGNVKAFLFETDTNIPNGGWTNLVANSTTYTRVSGSYSNGDWSWFSGSNPLGTSGTVPITWG